MSIFDKLFGRKEQKNNSEPKRLPTIEEFPKLISENRMRVIMILGDSGNLDFFPFLKYAIQDDSDINVKFVALKRIHLFKNHPHTIPMLTELKNNGIGEKFEPYFSMALSRLGIISIKEFEEKMNGN
ncbi:MAG: hypothetical protein ABI549_01115 [Flavobacterium sp.]|uniref:hypothetical protein n=1 Tax=Flavobacterium sp. TaxID=239 RepID=UPI0032674D34